MEKNKTLTLEKVVTAGWFQWYDLENSILYPECHVLVYKLENDHFFSEILDFNIGSSGTSINTSFDSATELSLEFLQKYRELKGEMEYSESSREYWDKFRDLFSPVKMKSFITESGNRKRFPFNLYHDNVKLKQNISILKNDIEALKIQFEKITSESIVKDGIIEILRAKIDEMDDKSIRYSERPVAKNFELEEYLLPTG